MRIRYEEIVSAYEEGLRTQLRGFRPAHDFLDTWVHDEDPARSILSMVESAGLGGVKSLEVDVGPETARRIDARRLEALTARSGKATVTAPEGGRAGLLLRVDYS